LGRQANKGKKARKRKEVPPPASPQSEEQEEDQDPKIGGEDDDAERENEDQGEESDGLEDEEAPTISATKGTNRGPGSRRWATGGGLFGATSMPATLSAMPRLLGQTHEEYTEWRPKAQTWLQANSLSEVTVGVPAESLGKAIKMDCDQHHPQYLRGMWLNLHQKATASIQAATEAVLGQSFFNAIEDDQARMGVFEICNTDPEDPNTFKEFIQNNANHLWERIRAKCGTVTPQRLGTLMKRYTSLSYSTTQKPEDFRKEFEKIVNELAQNGMEIPEKCHMAMWYNALPAELSALRQGLNARKELTWQDIYDALQSQFSKHKAQPHKGEEQALLSAEGGRQRKKKQENLSRVKCYNCDKMGHYASDCLKPDRRGQRGDDGSSKKNKRVKHNKQSQLADDELDESKFEYGMPLIEEEEMVLAMAELDRQKGVADRQTEAWPVHFVFDSAATSHVTPYRSIVKNLRHVPDVRMATAMDGVTLTVTQRGTVQVSDNIIIKDVALLPKAHISLLSEGRLADSGCTIIKNKEWVKVTDESGKTLLRGVRAGKLWTVTVGRPQLKKRPLNTILSVPNTMKRAQQDGRQKRQAQGAQGPSGSPTASRDE
jgi:Pol polyprotein, beta-barrel domain/gag-polypeptide of LTR copia-type/Zinc knuckle